MIQHWATSVAWVGSWSVFAFGNLVAQTSPDAGKLMEGGALVIIAGLTYAILKNGRDDRELAARDREAERAERRAMLESYVASNNNVAVQIGNLREHCAAANARRTEDA